MFRHLLTFQPIACPTSLQSSCYSSFNQLQWRKTCCGTLAVVPQHHSTCRLLGVRNVTGIPLSVHAWTLVDRTWLPNTSCLSVGWVSCFRPSLSVCNRTACCICRPSTVPSPLNDFQRSTWLYLQPRCILTHVPCILGQFVPR